MRFAVPGEPDPNTIVVARSRHAPGNPSGTSFQVVAHYRQDVFATVPAQLGEIFDLTQAEQGVATAIMKGQRLSNQAKALGLSHETVRWHAKNILAKAGCSSQIEFVRLAMSILRPVG